ncbi:MAG: DnaA regulatory inactivator Hda [Burkholderiaceae bacterium]
MKQIPLPIGTAAARSFDNFATGANAATLAHLRSLRPGAAPVYLWGPTGSGKTHLTQGLIGCMQADGVRCASYGAEVAAPWIGSEPCGIVVIDDCERLDAEQQSCAFSLFVQAASTGATIVAAGRLPPVDLALREDLRSRLGWGYVMAVHALSEHEARAELRRDADRRGILLTDEVMEYLLTRFARDLKSLFDLLDRLDQFSMAQQRSVTVALLKQMLAQEPAA